MMSYFSHHPDRLWNHWYPQFSTKTYIIIISSIIMIIMFSKFMPYIASEGNLKSAIKEWIRRRNLSKARIPKTNYDLWCYRKPLYVNIVSSMPENPLLPTTEYFKSLHPESLLLLKEDQKWRLLFISPEKNDKDWYKGGWYSKELAVSEINGLKKVLDNLSDIAPEDLHTKDKIKIADLILKDYLYVNEI